MSKEKLKEIVAFTEKQAGITSGQLDKVITTKQAFFHDVSVQNLQTIKTACDSIVNDCKQLEETITQAIDSNTQMAIK